MADTDKIIKGVLAANHVTETPAIIEKAQAVVAAVQRVKTEEKTFLKYQTLTKFIENNDDITSREPIIKELLSADFLANRRLTNDFHIGQIYSQLITQQSAQRKKWENAKKNDTDKPIEKLVEVLKSSRVRNAGLIANEVAVTVGTALAPGVSL